MWSGTTTRKLFESGPMKARQRYPQGRIAAHEENPRARPLVDVVQAQAITVKVARCEQERAAERLLT